MKLTYRTLKHLYNKGKLFLKIVRQDLQNPCETYSLLSKAISLTSFQPENCILLVTQILNSLSTLTNKYFVIFSPVERTDTLK